METARVIKRNIQDIRRSERESHSHSETLQMRESSDIDYLTLEEFCGRFDLTEAKAKWEIRRCELQDCGYSRYVLQYQFENGKGTYRITPDKSGAYLIPESEADRYQVIIENEHSKPATPEQAEQPAINIDAYMTENRGKISDGAIASFLFKNGFSNNKIGVAMGGTYRDGSNALAIKIQRLRKKHEKLLGT